ncbi:MAG: hypothetical protein V4683_15580 [Bacteroidota bacterium]
MLQTINQIIRFLQLPVLVLLFYLAYQKWWFWKGHYRYFIWFILALIFYFIVVLFLNYGLKSKELEHYFNYLFLPTDFVLLGLYLKGVINKPKIGLVINILSVLFVFYGIYQVIWLHQGMNLAGLFIQNIYLILLSSLSFRLIFKEREDNNIRHRPDFWFVLGILLSYLTFFLYLYSTLFKIELGIQKYRFIINILADSLNTLYLLFFIKGVSLIRK